MCSTVIYNIDEYIEQAKSMKNTSDGGSAAYHFDDVVLIKYTIPLEYGDARVNEEKVALEANKKKLKGVRTPAHLAIKRDQDDKKNICWVLQERAKGKCYAKYSLAVNDCQTQLMLQEKILNAPDLHYEQCIRDLCELFHMGLELKSKNIYYDDDKKNGGFTFIDLLGFDSRGLDPNSISDILCLKQYASFISNVPLISIYSSVASIDEKEKSRQMYYGMMKKTFIAMEKVIPTFKQYRRWVLRSYPEEILDYFSKNKVFVGDLSLDETEYQQFDYFIELIVNNSIEKIASGEKKFWEIRENEIRIELESMGLQDAWRFHKANDVRIENYDDDYDYEYAMKTSLQDKVNKLFCARLEEVAQNSLNLNILEAKTDFEKENIAKSARKSY